MCCHSCIRAYVCGIFLDSNTVIKVIEVSMTARKMRDMMKRDKMVENYYVEIIKVTDSCLGIFYRLRRCPCLKNQTSVV